MFVPWNYSNASLLAAFTSVGRKPFFCVCELSSLMTSKCLEWIRVIFPRYQVLSLLVISIFLCWQLDWAHTFLISELLSVIAVETTKEAAKLCTRMEVCFTPRSSTIPRVNFVFWQQTLRVCWTLRSRWFPRWFPWFFLLPQEENHPPLALVASSHPSGGILRFIVFARCARELGEEDTRSGGRAEHRWVSPEAPAEKNGFRWCGLYLIKSSFKNLYRWF